MDNGAGAILCCGSAPAFPGKYPKLSALLFIFYWLYMIHICMQTPVSVFCTHLRDIEKKAARVHSEKINGKLQVKPCLFLASPGIFSLNFDLFKEQHDIMSFKCFGWDRLLTRGLPFSMIIRFIGWKSMD